jgi:hypothetical protein
MALLGLGGIRGSTVRLKECSRWYVGDWGFYFNHLGASMIGSSFSVPAFFYSLQVTSIFPFSILLADHFPE